MIDETLELAAGDLDEARGKITATREALERALEAADSDEVRAAIARLERIEAELAAVERKVAGQAVKV
ncbi:hypothetical protein [Planctomyces sp. SH-PL62]|uniref:hypothetical protein n=1 Tax=Planctomyces sp. SH-PL62 TaxID=1636152 RepID=UPI00078E0AC4|nr:hypothetical protein [Planctomyces sp. SH-PL62]AMV40160.1 hypothetical protein VT85_22200 [Planctomyces sp. SH-PL62]